MSIFTQIIQGDIPCYKIYENELVLAFLDIHPINLGHTLVIPKVEVDKIYELEEPYYSAIFQAARLISRALERSTGCLRVCSWAEGFAVPHAHYHICPFYQTEDEFWHKQQQDSPPTEEMLNIQTKILQELAKSA